MAIEIVSINVGKPKKVTYKGKAIETGINKSQVKGLVYLGKLNFEGDGQADLVHHGGGDKAVCVYPYEHYAFWEKDLGKKMNVGAFGENLTLKGMLESHTHIGDVFQIGEAVVQVSQPRQPCHKLAKKHDILDLPVRVQDTGYTGFYFRVLKEGWIARDSSIDLIEVHPKRVTVEFANQVMHHEKKNQTAIEKILEVNELSADWRDTFLKRLEKCKEG